MARIFILSLAITFALSMLLVPMIGTDVFANMTGMGSNMTGTASNTTGNTTGNMTGNMTGTAGNMISNMTG
ncbi:MAG: hypothetical protein QOK63_00765 [Nitrososphaeraceae archaeon]|nr:hypothetical protein [Nitrososphaeraceae archaeon]